MIRALPGATAALLLAHMRDGATDGIFQGRLIDVAEDLDITVKAVGAALSLLIASKDVTRLRKGDAYNAGKFAVGAVQEVRRRRVEEPVPVGGFRLGGAAR